MSEHDNQDPCDCFEPDCAECNQRKLDQEDGSMMGDFYHEMNEGEERELQQLIEGGDEDDYDEEDMHGSRPI
jgi:hypothetical protein